MRLIKVSARISLQFSRPQKCRFTGRSLAASDSYHVFELPCSVRSNTGLSDMSHRQNSSVMSKKPPPKMKRAKYGARSIRFGKAGNLPTDIHARKPRNEVWLCVADTAASPGVHFQNGGNSSIFPVGARCTEPPDTGFRLVIPNDRGFGRNYDSLNFIGTNNPATT